MVEELDGIDVLSPLVNHLEAVSKEAEADVEQAAEEEAAVVKNLVVNEQSEVVNKQVVKEEAVNPELVHYEKMIKTDKVGGSVPATPYTSAEGGRPVSGRNDGQRSGQSAGKINLTSVGQLGGEMSGRNGGRNGGQNGGGSGGKTDDRPTARGFTSSREQASCRI